MILNSLTNDFLASRLWFTIFWLRSTISLKNQDIRFNLIAFDSIRSTLHVNMKITYLSMKKNVLLSKKFRFSCLSSTEHYILAMIDDNSLKTQDIRSKLAAFDRIHLFLQVNIKTCIFRWKKISVWFSRVRSKT